MSDQATIPYSVHQDTLSESIGRKHQIQKLLKKISELEKRNQTLETEKTEAEEALVALGDERDELTARLEQAPDETRDELDKLKGELRTRDDQSLFDKVAESVGIRKDAKDAAWKLLGHKPEGDKTDEAKLTEAVKALVGANGFLKADAVASGSGGAAKAIASTTRPAGPGAARGGASDGNLSVADQVRAKYEANGRTAPAGV